MLAGGDGGRGRGTNEGTIQGAPCGGGVMTAKVKTIDGYIATLAPEAQAVAEGVRKAILEAAPDSVETVRYGMPTFQVGGASVLYFAVWKNHVGLYPMYRGTPEFEAEVGPFRAHKDTVQFPLDKPIPHDLISRMVHSQVARLSHAPVEG